MGGTGAQPGRSCIAALIPIRCPSQSTRKSPSACLLSQVRAASDLTALAALIPATSRLVLDPGAAPGAKPPAAGGPAGPAVECLMVGNAAERGTRLVFVGLCSCELSATGGGALSKCLTAVGLAPAGAHLHHPQWGHSEGAARWGQWLKSVL